MTQQAESYQDGYRIGRLAFYKNQDERTRIKAEGVKYFQANTKNDLEKLDLERNTLSDMAKKIQDEISQKKDISESVLRESLFRAIWVSLFLMVTMAGEFIFAHWTIVYFGLGRIETILVASAVVILTLKAMDYYLTYWRRLYPSHENRLFLMTACCGLVAIFLVLFFFAEIRQELFQTISLIGADGSSENTIAKADSFYRQNSRSFIWAMVVLTVAFALVSGMSFHFATQNFSVAIPYLRRYRRLREVRNQLIGLAERLSILRHEVDLFEWGFENGLVEEERVQTQRLEQLNAKQDQQPIPQPQKPQRIVQKDMARYLTLPIILILIAFALFILLRGEARGESYCVFFDITGSSSVKEYTGQQMEFDKNFRAVEGLIQERLMPGDSIKVLAITESTFSRPYVLVDEKLSRKKGAFGEVLAREKLRVLNAWRKVSIKPKAKATDIFGAVDLANILFSGADGKKSLIFYSDMRQCAQGFDFEKPSFIDVDKELQRLQKSLPIPSLEGVNVRCLGVHTAGKSAVYWLSLKMFWTQYFHLTKARMLTFSMERSFGDE